MSAEIFRHQRNFRVLLQAMARPGRLRRLEVGDLPSPAWAIAECLLDSQVSFCLAGSRPEEVPPEDFSAATGSQAAGLPEADFVFVSGPPAESVIRAARRGRPESPEEAATLVFSLTRRPPDPAERLRVRLSGPGIAAPEGIAPEMPGIPLPVFTALAEVNADYPLGVDAIFLLPNGELMCLPRSTRITVEG
jgi:alpha-D-ribose 1-methylphosphonate 5-triphosphate synthase subunit PhnH